MISNFCFAPTQKRATARFTFTFTCLIFALLPSIVMFVLAIRADQPIIVAGFLRFHPLPPFARRWGGGEHGSPLHVR